MKHELKTDSKVFKEVAEGYKTFEIRKNDRDFKVGDTLVLKETLYTGEEMKGGKPLHYTNHREIVLVTSIMNGPIYGLAEAWCIMSISLELGL